MPAVAKILPIALETEPESTIMESTTMSLASGSRPTCATWISPFVFFNSTALIELDPISRPTIVLAPPNKPMTFTPLVTRRYACGFRSLLPASFPFHALSFHPGVQNRFLELPAVPQLERRDLFLVHVLVK